MKRELIKIKKSKEYDAVRVFYGIKGGVSYMKIYIVEREYTKLCGLTGWINIDRTNDPKKWQREHQEQYDLFTIRFREIENDRINAAD